MFNGCRTPYLHFFPPSRVPVVRLIRPKQGLPKVPFSAYIAPMPATSKFYYLDYAPRLDLNT